MAFKPEFVAHVTQRRAALRAELAALLPPDAALVLEIGFDQGETVRRLLSGAGLIEIEVLPDAAGHDRIAIGRSAPH